LTFESTFKVKSKTTESSPEENFLLKVKNSATKTALTQFYQQSVLAICKAQSKVQ